MSKHKLLFIRFSSMGDAILTTGIFKALKESLPQSEISVLSYDSFRDVFTACPYVDKIHTIPRGSSITELIRFVRGLESYEHIFDLHAVTKSRICCLFLKGRVHRYNKLSLQRRLFVKFRLCKDALRLHVTERYAQAVFPALGLEVPPREDLRPCLDIEKETKPDKIVLHPFASKGTKVWPYFDRLAQMLAEKNKGVYIIGNGTFPDIAGVKRIKTESLADLFNFMADAALVLSNDSGPMHAAVALKRPLLGIFGSTTKELGFFPLFANCSCVQAKALSCRPCHVHGLNSCPRKHFDCMRGITPEMVMEAINSCLTKF